MRKHLFKSLLLGIAASTMALPLQADRGDRGRSERGHSHGRDHGRMHERHNRGHSHRHDSRDPHWYTRNRNPHWYTGHNHSRTTIIHTHRDPWPARGHVHGPVYRRPIYTTGQVVYSLPSGFLSISVGGSPYYYCDGYYFRRSYSGYQVVHAPVGAHLHALPAGCETIYLNGRRYYRHHTTYYMSSGAGYTVVDPGSLSLSSTRPTTTATEQARDALESRGLTGSTSPATTATPAATTSTTPRLQTVEVLPVGYETLNINGELIYHHAGTYYRWDPGRDAYIIIEDPTQA